MSRNVRVWQKRGGFLHPLQWLEPADLLSIRMACFEGLVHYDPKLRIVPALAESWKVSDDAVDWSFTLRDGVHFHDGTLLTAADAAESIRKASLASADGALGTSGLLYGYLGAAEIRADDPLHLSVHLPFPMADLPDLLACIMIVPAPSVEKAAGEVPGTGPFRFLGIDGKNIRFGRFDNYWGGPAEIDELCFTEEPDPSLRVEALLSGKADLISGIEGKYTPQIETNDDLCVIEHDSMTAVSLMLNCASGPFSDVRVRQAVNYGTDAAEIVQNACGGTAIPLRGPLTPRHFAAAPDPDLYAYDTGKAWNLLAESGFAEGLELTLYRPSRLPDNAGAIAKCLRQQWARIGIKLHEVVQPDREQYALDVKARRIHDLCLFDSSPVSTWRVLREKFRTGVNGSWNQGYKSETFELLMEQAERTPETGKRQALFHQAIGTVKEDAPWVFLYSPVDFCAAGWDLLELYPFLGQRADGLILFR